MHGSESGAGAAAWADVVKISKATVNKNCLIKAFPIVFNHYEQTIYNK
jgi:hypothetical protein